ncbi:MAG: ChbG/HpnK family deacetylase [bacterium]|nr:ChbG/HpnK family deacetylase [bacterium]
MKKIITTADDLGIDKETNEAIKECYESGVLTSSCLMAVGEAFDDAFENVIKTHPDLEIGVHLDIIECKALTQNGKSTLTDENGKFNNSYVDMLLKSYDKKFLSEVESEFNAQIEKILSVGIKPTYINTHVHTHSIPNLFKIICKSAEKYSIPNVRTQGELPYYTKGLKRHTSIRYCLNIIKNILLNTFTFINKNELKKYNLKTNKYFLGVLYTGQMDEKTVIAGIERLPENSLAEVICHPSVNPEKPRHYKEYKGLTSEKLKNFFKSEKAVAVNWQGVQKEIGD